ncbi:DNA-directed RNA polymerase subunit alpha C-terminal domain-containing protein [Endozoicomonas numazuensis]|uniref:HTH HARE-type domain-containing protein n=1 Tax=Endozoicomonas numazuensis TaxID=1137799 RepID=A0A081NHC5_9GAMM|nr:sigma factor-like helix-turn-helix DNA-binding protein [Endozoicomonas numazuensis]KEQ17848.1 hypothetical protein GZ78_09345 [Endozoicomonas numazuensis]
MAALKLYFALINEDSSLEVSVHRNLSTLREAWQQTVQADCVGIIHIGFIRPKIKNATALLKQRGKLLLSASAKWALPDAYLSSVAVIAELKLASQILPLYQLLQGFGCDAVEPQANFHATAQLCEQSHPKNDCSLTIAEAARQVLNQAIQPLNKEEIFARIVEQDLYRFGTKKPVSALSEQLNLYTRNTSDSNADADPLFIKTEGDRFCSLDHVSSELSGWVKHLAENLPELAAAANPFGLTDEKSYSKLADHLPARLRDQLDAYRFSQLIDTVDQLAPQELLNILPYSLLSTNISSINMSVRVFNVLKAHDIAHLADLKSYSVAKMLMWNNFGRKSVSDLCRAMIDAAEKVAAQMLNGKYNSLEVDNDGISDTDELKDAEIEHDEAYRMTLVSNTPLKSHFEKALAGLRDNHRQVIECRTGYHGTTMTLEEVGKLIGVTRERIRQIQKKYVDRIISTEFWDNCIAIKIGQLLINRETPLYIEMLEVEDPWFEGFIGNYQHLAAIIELFSENEIRIVKINGASLVTRIKLDDWEQCISHFRKSLKDKATEGSWTRQDIDTTFRASLSEKGAPELVPLMWDEFENALQFEGEGEDAKLLSFGVSADSVIQAVLLQAESPLHFTEVAARATKLLGKPVDERRAQNSLMSQGAKLYGRGIYGLEKFNPISPRMCSNIRLAVCNILYEGPLMKQWHANEILGMLQAKFPSLPEELDNYILNIILQEADRLVYLNRMVWARVDSKQDVNDRVDMADAFTQILEEHGGPLKGKEIKDRLAAIRGVSNKLQLQPTERMIQIGPDFWGLVERDIGGTPEGNAEKLNNLYQKLQERQKGIHVSEVWQYVSVSDSSREHPSPYALLNLAQRDSRFYLGRAMYLGLSEWGDDTRRLNIAQAVRKLFKKASSPMTIAAINAEIEDLIEMPVDGSVTNTLINSGATFDSASKRWHFPKN